MRKIIPAYEFRRRAREAMKPAMNVLVVALLIAMLPSLIGNVITILTESDPSAVLSDMYTEERITAMSGADTEAAVAASEEILNGITAFCEEKWPFIALTALIALLFSPALTLGLNHTLLKTLRKEEITYTTVLARMPIFLKAIGLNLMMYLRIFLWMLPGWAVSLLGAVLLLYVPALGGVLMVAAMILMFVQMLQAMYRYRLATYVMADAPETGINAAIRRSKEIMKGRKMELLSLEISFLGWQLLIYFAQVMLLGMLGTVIGMTLGMFASFLLQMYMYMATAAFYQEYGVAPAAEAEYAPQTDELN